jgi:hypothetical protein
VAPAARRRNAKLSFAFVFPDKNGRFKVQEVNSSLCVSCLLISLLTCFTFCVCIYYNLIHNFKELCFGVNEWVVYNHDFLWTMMGQIGVINYYVNTKSCLFECYYGVWRKVLLQLEPEGFCGLCKQPYHGCISSFFP